METNQSIYNNDNKNQDHDRSYHYRKPNRHNFFSQFKIRYIPFFRDVLHFISSDVIYRYYQSQQNMNIRDFTTSHKHIEEEK